MAKSYQDDSDFNPRSRAQHALSDVIDVLLDEESEVDTQQIPVDEALAAAPIIARETTRHLSRVLFVTSDSNYIAQDSAQQKQLIARSAYFSEQHVVVLVAGKTAKMTVKRIHERVWIYTLATTYWWWAAYAIIPFAKQHLFFAGNFRPDLVVGLEPDAAGLAAKRVAEKFGRPWQVQVPVDFLTASTESTTITKWHVRCARYVVRRAKSIRTTTSAVAESLRQWLPKHQDLKVLPHFFDVWAFQTANPTFSLKERYKDYAFMLLYWGTFDVDSEAFRVIDAARHLLRSPRIGLLLAGSGRRRDQFMERARILGIAEQVIFVTAKPSDAASYFKTADLCVVPEITASADETVLQAAAAGLPVVATKNELRSDLFVDGEDMFLCESSDSDCLRQYITKLVNDTALRKRFSDGARYVIETRLEQDESAYYEAYRDSLEAVFMSTESESVNRSATADSGNLIISPATSV